MKQKYAQNNLMIGIIKKKSQRIKNFKTIKRPTEPPQAQTAQTAKPLPQTIIPPTVSKSLNRDVFSTYIIPVRIDCKERMDNITLTVRYLLNHTNGKIIITESDKEQKLNFENTDRLTYIFRPQTTTYFHRTRLINEMISLVDTIVTANYDADILLPPESYITAEDLIVKDDCDLIYPYGFDCKDQRMIYKNKCNINLFKRTLNLNDLGKKLPDENCQYGHCQFFKTKSYIEGFMENEEFLPLAPEDKERGIRFQKLGYKVVWFRGLVYHQEHPKLPANNIENPRLKQNLELMSNIEKWNKDDILKYYNNLTYWKKYKK